MTRQIPFFAVGYRGWKTIETIEKKRQESGLDGILVLESGLFSGKKYQEAGPAALYAFFIAIQELTGGLVSSLSDYKAYAMRQTEGQMFARM